MTPRSVWTIVTSLTLGPAFGGLTFIVFMGVTDAMVAQPANPATVFGIEEYWPIIMVAAYVLGAIPGLLSAIAMIVLTHRLPRLWQRLAVATIIGAVLSLLGLAFLLFTDGGSLYDLMIGGGFMLSGAVAALACMAIVELFHPLARPEPATP